MQMRSLWRVGAYAGTVLLLLGAVAWAANFTINGNLIVNGDSTTNKLTAKSDVSADGNLSVRGSASTGKLTANGDIAATGYVRVAKEIESAGSVFAANLTATGHQLDGQGIVTTNQVVATGPIAGGSIRSDGPVTSGTDLIANRNLTVKQRATFQKFYRSYSLSVSNGGPSKTQTTPMGKWDICMLSMVTSAGEDSHRDDQATCSVSSDVNNAATDDRPSWTLYGAIGSNNVDYVACASICMSFSTTDTSN